MEPPRPNHMEGYYCPNNAHSIAGVRHVPGHGGQTREAVTLPQRSSSSHTTMCSQSPPQSPITTATKSWDKRGWEEMILSHPVALSMDSSRFMPTSVVLHCIWKTPKHLNVYISGVTFPSIGLQKEQSILKLSIGICVCSFPIKDLEET